MPFLQGGPVGLSPPPPPRGAGGVRGPARGGGGGAPQLFGRPPLGEGAPLGGDPAEPAIAGGVPRTDEGADDVQRSPAISARAATSGMSLESCAEARLMAV